MSTISRFLVFLALSALLICACDAGTEADRAEEQGGKTARTGARKKVVSERTDGVAGDPVVDGETTTDQAAKSEADDVESPEVTPEKAAKVLASAEAGAEASEAPKTAVDRTAGAPAEVVPAGEGAKAAPDGEDAE